MQVNQMFLLSLGQIESLLDLHHALLLAHQHQTNLQLLKYPQTPFVALHVEHLSYFDKLELKLDLPLQDFHQSLFSKSLQQFFEGSQRLLLINLMMLEFSFVIYQNLSLYLQSLYQVQSVFLTSPVASEWLPSCYANLISYLVVPYQLQLDLHSGQHYATSFQIALM
ncbi:hypothetical protein B4158_5995 [Bacillus cereus]|nr:hypothetical protein B4158_5995 [Bacillus cereus]